MPAFIIDFTIALLFYSQLSCLCKKNLSGVWVGNYSEDYPDRLPGPELGDYGGLPINRVTAVNKYQALRALIALFKRLLCRAALLAWIMLLSAMLSIMGTAIT